MCVGYVQAAAVTIPMPNHKFCGISHGTHTTYSRGDFVAVVCQLDQTGVVLNVV